MTTEIRLITRNGPATTVRFEGTFEEFTRRIVSATIDAKHNGTAIAFAAFPTFFVNLNELAFATVYAVSEPETVKGPAV